MLNPASPNRDHIGVANVSSLYGMSVFVSTQIPIDQARPGSSEWYFVLGNFAHYLIGESDEIKFSISTEADTAFAADQVWLKLVNYVGCLAKQPAAFAVIKGIS